MAREVAKEIAALVSLTLFGASILIWAVVIAEWTR